MHDCKFYKKPRSVSTLLKGLIRWLVHIHYNTKAIIKTEYSTLILNKRESVVATCLISKGLRRISRNPKTPSLPFSENSATFLSLILFVVLWVPILSWVLLSGCFFLCNFYLFMFYLNELIRSRYNG